MLQRILSTEEVRCLSPVQSDVPPLTFQEISERRFAEQLTRMDAVSDAAGAPRRASDEGRAGVNSRGYLVRGFMGHWSTTHYATKGFITRKA